jgi:Tol biopolymer transport system component
VIGRTFGSYQVLAKLGEGGMGEVYRAHDTRLGRDVALKVLRASIAHDPARRVRFDREARLLATLNHANIAAIHGIADADDQVALVLELVEGPTLADRLASGPLPLPEALGIARQIGDALEAAHEKRIIHRDLKPQNIKFTSSGGVKLLDFGIGKALAADDAGEASAVPTATVSTRAGAVLGTAAYMSPEQARGQPIDKRTDIWAFGCVLYEMLTGRTAFAGPTLSDTVAAVLERDPDWTALPSATPAHLRRLLHRSLDKDPRRRLRDIGDATVDLVPAHDVEASSVTAPLVGPRAQKWRLAVAALGLVLATALITHIAWPARLPPQAPAAGSVRFTIPPPDGWRFGSAVADVETTYLALSPDGSQLAFVAMPAGAPGSASQPRTSAVWLRSLASLDAQRLSGTDGAISVFWSPDGRSLAFFANDKLKRLDLPDGAPVPIADVSTRLGLTGTWGDGRILFDSVQSPDIFGVSTAGGTAATVVSRDESRQESQLFWPRFLPDGQRALYLARQDDGQGDLRLRDRSGASRSVMRVASNVEYVDPGYLVFVRDSTLVGQRVDASTGTVVGEPFAIAEEIDYSFYPPRAAFSASRSGTVAYQSHRDVSRLVWIDQAGQQVGALGAPAGYFVMRMSRERNHLIIAVRDDRIGTSDLWTVDLTRGGMQGRLTTDPRPELPGPWLPGANAFVFSAARGGPPQLFLKDLASGVERELLPRSEFHLPSDTTADGKTIVFAERAEGAGSWDLSTLSLDQGAKRSPLLTTPFSELDGRLSPDGKLLAFVSDEAKRFNVYVTSFPPSGRPRQVSIDGGTLPRWRPDGRELFYLSGTREIMAAPIRTAPALEVGPARALFSIGQRPWIDFDVAADDRFLALVAQAIAREQPVTVIVNWPAALRR